MSSAVSSDRLDFVSLKRTATNMPVDWIKIRRIESDLYSREIGYIDTRVKYDTYNRKEMEQIIKNLVTEVGDEKYEMYGTLFLSYIMLVNPRIKIYVKRTDKPFKHEQHKDVKCCSCGWWWW